MGVAHYVIYRFINACMYAQCQTKTARIDVIDQLRQFVPAIAQYMQYRAEYFMLQFRDAVDLDDAGRDEVAVRCEQA
ncbi:hypothetical protein D3C81_2004130 [compost metagenome]